MVSRRVLQAFLKQRDLSNQCAKKWMGDFKLEFELSGPAFGVGDA